MASAGHLAGAVRRHLLTESRRPAAVRSSARAHWYVVATVCIGAFMGQLDASIVTLALPRLGRDLHAGVGAVEWVALAYLLVLVATLAAVGRIADAVGRKLMYVYGFGVFTAASVLCGLAPTLPVLIAARVLQAVGAAMLQANSVALITEAVPRPLLGRAIGVQGTAQALGLALGPAIGGLLLTLGGWRLIFLVNLPAGAIGLTLGWLLLPRSRSRRPIDGADRLGALLLALAAAGPLVYLSLSTSHGYDNVALLLALGAGLVAAIGFVLRERVTAAPLIDLSILRRPALSTGLSSGLISYLVLFGTLYVVPYYLSAKDVHPALIGLQLAVLPVTLGIAALIAGRLLTRVGDRPLTAGGLILAAAGMLEIALWHGMTGLFTGLAITGLGLGAFTPANNATIMSASPAGHTGVVSGMLNMTRGIGTALGLAVAGALYTAAAAANGPNARHASLPAAESGLTLALAVLGLLALATSLALLLSVRREAHPVDGRDDGRGSASPEALTASVDPHQPTGARYTRPHRRRTGHPFHAGQFGSRPAPTLESPEGGEPMRDLLEREWEKTAVLTLVLATVAGLRARLATPRWAKGGLVVGLYFVVLSLLFWLRATQLRRSWFCTPSAARVIALVCVLAVEGLLLALDIITTGKV